MGNAVESFILGGLRGEDASTTIDFFKGEFEYFGNGHSQVPADLSFARNNVTDSGSTYPSMAG